MANLAAALHIQLQDPPLLLLLRIIQLHLALLAPTYPCRRPPHAPNQHKAQHHPHVLQPAGHIEPTQYHEPHNANRNKAGQFTNRITPLLRPAL